MQRTRILIILETSSIGGIENQALLTVRHLDKLKYEIHLMVTDVDWVLGPLFKEEVDEYISLDDVEGFWDVVSTPSDLRLQIVTKYIEHNEIDLVHLFNGIQYIFAIPEDVPTVMHLGGDYSRKAYYEKVNQTGNRREVVTDFISNSDNIKLTSDMPQNANVFNRDVTEIPNYIEYTELPDIDKDDKTIIWVGRDSPEKHPEMVLEIARKLEDYTFIMVIASLGELSLQSIPNNVIVYRNITDRQDLMELYKSADIFLLTSDTEGFPLTIPEAGSQGCMPVVSEVGNINNDTVPVGYRVKHTDPKYYIIAIKHWADVKDDMKTTLRRLVMAQAKNLDIVSGIKNIESVYSELLPPVAIVEQTDIAPPQPEPIMEEEEYYNPPEYERIETRVKAISWGGNFFLGLVRDELNRACNLHHVEPPFDDDEELLSECDVLWVVCPRISEKYVIKHHLRQGKKVIWHWIGSDILTLIDHYKGCGQLPEMFTWRSNQQRHLGVSKNLVEELNEMGLSGAEELNLVSNWDFDLEPLPDEFTVLVYYPPKGDPEHEYANIYGQDVIQKVIGRCPHIKFILYGMREGQKLDFVQPENVELEMFTNDKEYMRKLYKRGSVLLRYTMHDGYPSSIIEAVMMGRQVITNCKFPYTMHTTSEDDIVGLLEYIKDFKIMNHRGSKYYHQTQTQEVFVRRFIDYLRGL